MHNLSCKIVRIVLELYAEGKSQLLPEQNEAQYKYKIALIALFIAFLVFAHVD